MPNLKIDPSTGARYIAGFTSVLAGGPTVVANGRTYAAGAAKSVDRLSIDYPLLLSSGWYPLAAHTGTTAQRPVDTEHGHALPPGFSYLDTSLGKVVVRTNGQWIDVNTGLIA